MDSGKIFRIGFLGMGTVAQGVWKHLQANRDIMKQRLGGEFELAKACVRNISKRRAVEIPESKLTLDPYEIINDPSIDIVCELMGGTGKALELTLAALRAGKVVVSANKAVICSHGAEIFAEARKGGGAYFFEASVAGGIPIIKVLREGLIANRFSLIYGILNGTCNYILTRMERENATYEAILKDARRLGYVEADESLDIDGWDAAHKIAILAYLAHGCWIGTDKMLVSGIRGIRLEDMIWARDFNCRVKLIAAIRKLENGALFASVYPALLPLTDVVANVNEVYNAVSLSGDVVGRTVHIGRGAGQDATASAVIADISDALKYLLGAPAQMTFPDLDEPRMATLDEVDGDFYLRFEVEDKAGVLATIASVLAKEDISIKLLQQRKHDSSGKAWIVMTTHKTTEGAIKKACESLSNLPVVSSEPFVIRIFDSQA